jgi:hypothetical protein
MTPTEIQEFIAKSRAKDAARKARKFKTHIDPRTDRPHEPRNHEEAMTLIALADRAGDQAAGEYYADEVMSRRLP